MSLVHQVGESIERRVAKPTDHRRKAEGGLWSRRTRDDSGWHPRLRSTRPLSARLLGRIVWNCQLTFGEIMRKLWHRLMRVSRLSDAQDANESSRWPSYWSCTALANAVLASSFNRLFILDLVVIWHRAGSSILPSVSEYISSHHLHTVTWRLA